MQNSEYPPAFSVIDDLVLHCRVLVDCLAGRNLAQFSQLSKTRLKGRSAVVRRDIWFGRGENKLMSSIIS